MRAESVDVVIGGLTLAKLGHSRAGELVRCQVARKTKHGTSFWSKTHICEVDHMMPSGSRWVRPLCGTQSGRAEHGSRFDEDLCKVCLKRAKASAS